MNAVGCLLRTAIRRLGDLECNQDWRRRSVFLYSSGQGMLHDMDTATRDYMLEHHHEIYKSQAERTDKIYGRFSLLVTPFTILGGGLLYVFRNYPHGWIGAKSLLFYVPFSVSAAAFLTALAVAFYCLARGFDYMSIRRPRLLQQEH